MEEQNNPSSDEQQTLIREALNKVSSQEQARRAAEESQVPEPDYEIPENLEEGSHNIQEMGVLARIGKHTHSFDFYGNKIVLRTLQVGEELELLQKSNAFIGQQAQDRAYTIYATANSIETVNGKPYFKRLPLGPNDDIHNYKFREFLKLYPITINTFVREYQIMRREAEEEGRYAKKE